MAGDYLEKVVRGEKTIESRFSRVKCPPFNCVTSGDVILFKKPGGPIKARATAAEVLNFSGLTPDAVRHIMDKYRDGLRLCETLMRAKLDARYCTLVFLTDVQRVVPFPVHKKDRRGWVVLRSDQNPCDIQSSTFGLEGE
jgi:hypothetical protein